MHYFGNDKCDGDDPPLPMSGLTPIIHHYHINPYIGNVEMIDSENTGLTPIIHHFHSNAYTVTVEMIGDNTYQLIYI